ncbi:MAG: hypothetical protein EWV62_22395 [Microcystis aeruginosa Ma_OC_LR_19540900_S633]|nr:MAG: hypothetical protein EWV62_22395 [Microcystis aeruginosa Ma_OC_LR_19540900_S633]
MPPLSRGIPPPIGTPLIKGGRGDRHPPYQGGQGGSAPPLSRKSIFDLIITTYLSPNFYRYRSRHVGN